MNFVNRCWALLTCNANAWRYGITYGRAKTFKMPKCLVLNEEQVCLSLPTENGVTVAFLDIFLHDVYGLSLLRNRAIKTVVDVGANVGLFSLAARSFFPKARIHAYEPNPRLTVFLKHQAEVGKYQIFPEAVGANPGMVRMEDHRDSVLGMVSNDFAGTIKKITFRSAIERLNSAGEVDLLKMDCEGGEWEILQDADSMRRIRFLRAEYHLMGQYTHDDFIEKLTALGFRIEKQIKTPTDGIVWAENKMTVWRGE